MVTVDVIGLVSQNSWYYFWSMCLLLLLEAPTWEWWENSNCDLHEQDVDELVYSTTLEGAENQASCLHKCNQIAFVNACEFSFESNGVKCQAFTGSKKITKIDSNSQQNPKPSCFLFHKFVKEGIQRKRIWNL